MSLLYVLLLTNIHISNSAYPVGNLIYEDQCDIDDFNQWTWGGAFYGPPSSSTNCPGTGYYCFGLAAQTTGTDGYVTKSFSTAGLWDLWVQMDINVIFDDIGDRCYIRLSHNGGTTFLHYIEFDHTVGENTIHANIPDTIYYNNPSFTVSVAVDGEDNDACYFRKFRIYGKPITASPTRSPTPSLTPSPTPAPTTNPTKIPTKTPTKTPTKIPTFTTNIPSHTPTKSPNNDPTISPTLNPTTTPTNPTLNPTISPTLIPTISPTKIPSINPTQTPSISTENPSQNPTETHSITPTNIPTIIPTDGKSRQVSGITTTEIGQLTGSGAFQYYLITVVAVSILVIAICGCLIFFCCYMKKNLELKKSRMELTTLKQNSFSPGEHITRTQLHQEQNSSTVDIINMKSMTPEDNNSNNNNIDLEQLMVPSEIQLEGIMKGKNMESQMTINSEELYEDKDEDMYENVNGKTDKGDLQTLGGRDTRIDSRYRGHDV